MRDAPISNSRGVGASRVVSWPEALLSGVARLPGPPWAAYAAAVVVLSVLGALGRWIVGIEPVGQVSWLNVLDGVFPPVFLAAMSWLNGIAEDAVDRLRPALVLGAVDGDDLRADIVRTPAGMAVLAVIVGFAFSAASVLTDPSGYGLPAQPGTLVWIEAAFFSGLSTVLAFVFVTHVIHQLRIIDRVHRDAVQVDLFHLEPLYSFASLTARTGIVLVAITAFGVGALSLINGRLLGSGSVFDALTILGILAVAVASFSLPLLGLHGRISDERDRQRAAAASVVGRTITELQARSAAGDHEGVAAMNNAVAAATAAVGAISRISTWPWRPETLRGFTSAIGLPVVIWVITAVLSRLIPR